MRGKWTLLAFLCGIFFIYTVDRSLLGLLAIPIQRETGLSDTAFGVLNAAVFWTYAAFVPFSGIAGDRFSRRRVIGVAAILWSLAMIAAGFAGGFWSLLVLVSFAVTAPQTLYGPSANALLAEMHRETRATALSLHQAAYYAGWFASGGAAAVLLTVFGTWRAAYFAFGLIGLGAGIVFLLLAGKEGRTRRSSSAKPSVPRTLRAFFGCPSALLAAAGYVAVVFVSFGYSAWGPKFVALKFGLSPERAGAGVMFWHFAASFAAILLAGVVSDACAARWPRFRLALQVLSLALAAPMLALFGFGHSVAAVFLAAAAFGALRGLFESNAFTSLFDVVPAECRAASVGFLNVLAGLLGSLAPIVLGVLSDRRGLTGFSAGFAFFGLVLAVAAVLMAVSLFFTFNRDRTKEES